MATHDLRQRPLTEHPAFATQGPSSAGDGVDIEMRGVTADPLGARRIGTVRLAAAQAAHVQSALGTDQAILDTRQRLWDGLSAPAETGGATALEHSPAVRPTQPAGTSESP